MSNLPRKPVLAAGLYGCTRQRTVAEAAGNLSGGFDPASRFMGSYN